MPSSRTLLEEPASFRPPRTELSRLPCDSWVSYTPGWLEPAAARQLYQRLEQEVQWQQRSLKMFGKLVAEPRLVAWAGELAYRYSGQTLQPKARPRCLVGLWQQVEQHAGQKFNHVLINRYRDHNDAMGFHADDEPELGRDPLICSVSLGASRRFLLKPKRGVAAPGQARYSWCLEGGSLLTMGGSLQHYYRHAVPRQTRPSEPRINLTFRLLRRPPGST